MKQTTALTVIHALLAEWAGAVDLAEEYNLQLANMGDIVRQNSYPVGVLRNHPTGKLKPPFRLWKDGPTVMDLGPGMPGEKGPELDWFDPSEVTADTMTYLDTLKKELRMAMAIPPVAIGEDEGSQRYSLTLITRMFPMKSPVFTERWLWTSAVVDLNRMALQMAEIKRIDGLEDLDVAAVGITPNWAPMLPRDRAELVNELVQPLQEIMDRMGAETAEQAVEAVQRMQADLLNLDFLLSNLSVALVADRPLYVQMPPNISQDQYAPEHLRMVRDALVEVSVSLRVLLARAVADQATDDAS